MRSIYIAGPMRGLPYYNFPAFDAARDILRAGGWEVVSPADLDRRIHGFDPNGLPASYDWFSVPSELTLLTVVRTDLDALLSCDAVFALQGWEDSTGATAELAVARWLGLEVILESSGYLDDLLRCTGVLPRE